MNLGKPLQRRMVASRPESLRMPLPVDEHPPEAVSETAAGEAADEESAETPVTDPLLQR